MRSLITVLVLPVLFCLTSYTPPPKSDTAKGKIYFSNQPFTTGNTGSKKNFSSGEFIYGRLELDAQTLKEAFSISDKSIGYVHGFLFYTITIFYNDKEIGSNLNTGSKKILLQGKYHQDSWLNFDVLPEPVKASTVLLSSEKLNASRSTVPFYHLIDGENLRENGEYRIVVKLFLQAYDSAGKVEPELKWTKFEDDFSFNFNMNDVALIKKNKKEADAIIQETVFELSDLPEIFNNPAKTANSDISDTEISAILKRDMSHLAVVRFALASYKDSLWRTEKDKYGQIIQQYLVPRLYIAYRRDDKCFIDNVQLAKKYLGESAYGPLRVYHSPIELRKPKTISCNKIN